MQTSGAPDVCAAARSGSSGTVQLAQDLRTGRLAAIKFLHQGPGFDEKVIARELLNHKACAMHPHIVQLQASNPLPIIPDLLCLLSAFGDMRSSPDT